MIITTYNRSNYYKEFVKSLSRADIPEGTEVVFVDDCSTDPEIENLNAWIYCFSVFSGAHYVSNDVKGGIKKSLKTGFEYVEDCDLIINLDPDSIVRNDFITELVKLHERFPNNLITGFECTNKNEDGTPRHKTIGEGFVP